jgi:AcrR family transcriptional regulator
LTGEPRRPDEKLRNAPTQARSRARLRRVLDAADDVLAIEGAEAFTTTRVAEVASVPIGSVYRFFPDKEAIVEALAIRYWSDFEDLVAGAAEADELGSLADAGSFVIDTLAAGFRSRPGFIALWYGGLRTEAVRDVTRPTREAIAASIERILSRHWPDVAPTARAMAARMVVLAGDGLLREAFRLNHDGDRTLLEESKVMLHAYLVTRLGEPC